MTALDRVMAAISDESPITREQQYELVQDLLSRKRRPEQGRLTPNPAGQQQPPPVDDEQSALPAEQVICANCLIRVDEAGFCPCCGLSVRRLV